MMYFFPVKLRCVLKCPHLSVEFARARKNREFRVVHNLQACVFYTALSSIFAIRLGFSISSQVSKTNILSFFARNPAYIDSCFNV